MRYTVFYQCVPDECCLVANRNGCVNRREKLHDDDEDNVDDADDDEENT